MSLTCFETTPHIVCFPINRIANKVPAPYQSCLFPVLMILFVALKVREGEDKGPWNAMSQLQLSHATQSFSLKASSICNNDTRFVVNKLV